MSIQLDDFPNEVMTSRLDGLKAGAMAELRERRQETSDEALRESAYACPPPRPFAEALSTQGISLIAEHKRRSPSAEQFRHDRSVDRSVEEIVRAYDAGGASALSILTQKQDFGGSIEDLRAARTATALPLLRKDFTFDPYQLWEARVAGADAVLLIVACFPPQQSEAFKDLHEEALSLDLDVIVEVRDSDELERALALDAAVIGINNRDLDTLQVDVETTHKLLPQIPAGKIVVSESGIATAEEVERLEQSGVDAVLIGSELMRAQDPEAATRQLARFEEPSRA